MQGDERTEVVVSASTDGRIVQWTMRKGLEHADLLRVKRVAKVRAAPLVRVKVRFTVKTVICCRRRLSHTAFVTHEWSCS